MSGRPRALSGDTGSVGSGANDDDGDFEDAQSSDGDGEDGAARAAAVAAASAAPAPGSRLQKAVASVVPAAERVAAALSRAMHPEQPAEQAAPQLAQPPHPLLTQPLQRRGSTSLPLATPSVMRTTGSGASAGSSGGSGSSSGSAARQQQQASPARAEYRKLAPPRHHAHAPKPRPARVVPPPPPPPPPPPGAGGAAVSFVGGAHLPHLLGRTAAEPSTASIAAPGAGPAFVLVSNPRAAGAGAATAATEAAAQVLTTFAASRRPSLTASSSSLSSSAPSSSASSSNSAAAFSGGGLVGLSAPLPLLLSPLPLPLPMSLPVPDNVFDMFSAPTPVQPMHPVAGARSPRPAGAGAGPGPSPGQNQSPRSVFDFFDAPPPSLPQLRTPASPPDVLSASPPSDSSRVTALSLSAFLHPPSPVPGPAPGACGDGAGAFDAQLPALARDALRRGDAMQRGEQLQLQLQAQSEVAARSRGLAPANGVASLSLESFTAGVAAVLPPPPPAPAPVPSPGTWPLEVAGAGGFTRPALVPSSSRAGLHSRSSSTPPAGEFAALSEPDGISPQSAGEVGGRGGPSPALAGAEAALEAADIDPFLDVAAVPAASALSHPQSDLGARRVSSSTLSQPAAVSTHVATRVRTHPAIDECNESESRGSAQDGKIESEAGGCGRDEGVGGPELSLPSAAASPSTVIWAADASAPTSPLPLQAQSSLAMTHGPSAVLDAFTSSDRDRPTPAATSGAASTSHPPTAASTTRPSARTGGPVSAALAAAVNELRVAPPRRSGDSGTGTARGCVHAALGAALGGVAALREAFGLVVPPRLPGLVAVRPCQRDFVELSALALCQRLEHASAAFVRLSQARSQLVAQNLAQIQLLFQRLQQQQLLLRQGQQTQADQLARPPQPQGHVRRSSDASTGSGLSADYSNGHSSLGRLSSSGFNLGAGAGVANSGGGSGSGRDRSTYGPANSASHDTGSVDGDSFSGTGPLGGGERAGGDAVPFSPPPPTAAEAAAQAEAAAAAVPPLPLRAPLETVWTMKFSPDGQFLAAAGGTDQGAVIRVWRVRAWQPFVAAPAPAPAPASAAAAAAADPQPTGAGAGAGAGVGTIAAARERSVSGHSTASTHSHVTDASADARATTGGVSAGPVLVATAAAAAMLAQLDLGKAPMAPHPPTQTPPLHQQAQQGATIVVGPAADLELAGGGAAPAAASSHTVTSPAIAAARMTGAPRHGRSQRHVISHSISGSIGTDANPLPGPASPLPALPQQRAPAQQVQTSAQAQAAAGVSVVELATHGQPFFEPEPVREWLGHEAHVVDLAWSRANLLLSASMDGWVRLWHVSRSECLHKFQHPDCVTAVAFHTSGRGADASLFLSGCFDRKLRLWSLETGRVTAWEACPAMITSAAFSPDGRLVVAGLFSGLCMVYAAEGLQPLRSVDCRNRRGPFRHGRKVTGVDFTPNSSHALITTNDSRVRMIDLLSLQTVTKYAGLRNTNMQVRASFDASALRVVSGSEDGRVFVWRTHNDLLQPELNPRLTGFDWARVRSFESFVADEGCQSSSVEAALRAEEYAELGSHARPAVTVALFAPTAALAIARPRALAAQWCRAAPSRDNGGGPEAGNVEAAEAAAAAAATVAAASALVVVAPAFAGAEAPASSNFPGLASSRVLTTSSHASSAVKDDREKDREGGAVGGGSPGSSAPTTPPMRPDGGSGGGGVRPLALTETPATTPATAPPAASASVVAARAAALAAATAHAAAAAARAAAAEVRLEQRLASHVVIVCADTRGVLRVFENCAEKARV